MVLAWTGFRANWVLLMGGGGGVPNVGCPFSFF